MKCSIHHDLFRTVTTRETKKMKHMMRQKERRKTLTVSFRRLITTKAHITIQLKKKKSCDQNAIEINVVLSLVYKKKLSFLIFFVQTI